LLLLLLLLLFPFYLFGVAGLLGCREGNFAGVQVRLAAAAAAAAAAAIAACITYPPTHTHRESE
jgi:hypothetical protein